VRGGEDRIGGLPGPNLPYRAAGARLDHRAILRLQRAAGNRSLAAFIPLMRVQHEPAAPVQRVKIDERAGRMSWRLACRGSPRWRTSSWTLGIPGGAPIVTGTPCTAL